MLTTEQLPLDLAPAAWQTDRRRSDDWPPAVARREALPAIARALTLKIRRLERRQERQA